MVGRILRWSHMPFILAASPPPQNVGGICACDITPVIMLHGTVAFKKGRLARWAWPNHNESLIVEFSLARGRRKSQRFKANERLDMPHCPTGGGGRVERTWKQHTGQRATPYWQQARKWEPQLHDCKELDSADNVNASRQELHLANIWIPASWHPEQRPGCV